MHPRFGPDRFMHHGHGPGARFFERGGIKFAILELLKDKPRHGYEIIREMEERSGGLYSPSPGAVYPTLQALEDQDLVSSNTDGGKRVYAVTEAGLEYLDTHKEQARSHREHWEAHWGAHGKGHRPTRETRDALTDLMRSVRRSAGDPEKMKEINEILLETARRVKEVSKR